MESIREQITDEILAEVQRTVAKYRVNTDNETLAAIASDAFCAGCGGYDIPADWEAFDKAFPLFREYL